jgi:hypothetical protein
MVLKAGPTKIMWKILATNLFIPLAYFTLIFLEYRRVLPIKYRLMLFDYGILFLFAQLIVVIITFFLWKKKNYRWVAIIIFLVYVVLDIFVFLFLPHLDLYD